MAALMRRLASPETRSGLLKKLDTCARDSPAMRATSLARACGVVPPGSPPTAAAPEGWAPDRSDDRFSASLDTCQRLPYNFCLTRFKWHGSAAGFEGEAR